jgi:hypothetical protein
MRNSQYAAFHVKPVMRSLPIGRLSADFGDPASCVSQAFHVKRSVFMASGGRQHPGCVSGAVKVAFRSAKRRAFTEAKADDPKNKPG